MSARISLCLGLIVLCGSAGAQTARILDARRSLAELTARQDAIATVVGANRAELSRLLGALELYARDPPPAILVSPGDVTDAVRGVILIRAVAPQLQARARRLSDEARALQGVRRQVLAAEGELLAAESTVEDRASRLEGVASEADSLFPPASRLARSIVQEGPAPDRLLAPLRGEIVTRFGARLKDGGMSRGLAIQAEPGAEVKAPAASIVDYAGPVQGWGQVLILATSGDYHLVISGLEKLAVAPGQRLAAGQVVGAMPAAGASTQLYVELRVGGTPVDPTSLMAEPAAKPPLLRRKLL